MGDPTLRSSGIVDVQFGQGVTVVQPVNLYGCRIGSSVFVGPFVEIQRDVAIGDREQLDVAAVVERNEQVGQAELRERAGRAAGQAVLAAQPRRRLLEAGGRQDHVVDRRHESARASIFDTRSSNPMPTASAACGSRLVSVKPGMTFASST